MAHGAVPLVNGRAGVRRRLAAEGHRTQKRKQSDEFLHAPNIHEIASEETEVCDEAKARVLLRFARRPDRERADFLRLQSFQKSEMLGAAWVTAIEWTAGQIRRTILIDFN